VPAAVHQTTNTLDVLMTRLHEIHEISVYDAIERLAQAGEAVGLDAQTLVRMLDRGITFEELLGLIESQMECSQRAQESAAERVSASASQKAA
jgi:hypothetical protein